MSNGKEERALKKKYRKQAKTYKAPKPTPKLICKWDSKKQKKVCKGEGVLSKMGIESTGEKLGAIGFVAGLLGAFTGAGGFKKKSNR